MERRRFLELAGIAALGLFGAGCAASTGPDDGGPGADGDAGEPLRAVDVVSPRDVRAPDGDARPAAFVVRTGFTVLLNDSSCSGHSHTVSVSPREFADDTPVRFLGGSHELHFRPSELVRLEAGERIPFATTGPGPGHGHCGTAWKTSVGPEEPNRPDTCRPIGTAECVL